MADTTIDPALDATIPRNNIGQTYEEWVDEQTVLRTRAKLFPEIKAYDVIVGRDEGKGITGWSFDDLGFITGHVTKAFAPQITDTIQQPIAKYGGAWEGMSYGARVFQVPVTLIADNAEEYNIKLHSLAHILIQPNTTEEMPVIFGDEPGVTWYGHWTELPDFQFITEGEWYATASLTFTATDPRGFMNVQDGVQKYGNKDYAPNHIEKVTSNPWTYKPLGTGPSEAVWHFSVKGTSKVDNNNIDNTGVYRYGVLNKNNGRSTYVGLPLTELKKIQNNQPTVFIDRLQALSTISQLTTDKSLGFNLGDGAHAADGTIEINPDSSETLQPHYNNDGQGSFASKSKDHAVNTSIKKGKNELYGNVAMLQPVNGPLLKSWSVTGRLRHIKEYGRANNRIELYLLDKKGNRRARFGIKDMPDGGYPVGYIKIGNTDKKPKTKGKKDISEQTAKRKGIGIYDVKGGQKKNGKDTAIQLTVDIGSNNDEELGTLTKTVERTEYTGTQKKVRTLVTKTKTYYDALKKKKRKTITTVSDLTSVTSYKGYPRNDNRNLSSEAKPGSNVDKKGRRHIGGLQYFKPGSYRHVNDNPAEDYVHSTKAAPKSKTTTADQKAIARARVGYNACAAAYKKRKTKSNSSKLATAKKNLDKANVALRVAQGAASKSYKKEISDLKKDGYSLKGGKCVKREKYKKKTVKREYTKNKTKVTKKNVYRTGVTVKAKTASGTTTETTVYVYYNGSGKKIESNKPGVLASISPSKTMSSVPSALKTTSQFTTKKTGNLNDKNEPDVFSNADFRFTLNQQVQANKAVKIWGEIVKVNDNTQVDEKVVAKFNKTLSAEDSKLYAFNLSRTALYFGKQSIKEDEWDDKTNAPLKKYKDDKLRSGLVEIKKLVSFDDPNIPHVILKKGQEGVINGITSDVFNDGHNANVDADIRSSFPQLIGGVSQTWSFTPSIADVDVYLEYRPTYL